MKKLVISFDTYSWIKYVAGCILLEPKEFVVTLIRQDSSPIIDCEILCEDAVLAQRRCDMFNIGKLFGIQKLQNLMYNDEIINIQKLSAQLQIQIVIGGVDTIYFQQSQLLRNVFKHLDIPSIDMYEYGVEDCTVSFAMPDMIYHKKLSAIDHMIGISKHDEITGFSQIEHFKKI